MVSWVRDLLTQFKGIAKTSDVTIEFTGMTPRQFSVRTEPGEQIVKRYLNGDTIRRHVVALEGLLDTLSDQDRERNNRLYAQLSLWLEHMTRKRTLPIMHHGAKPMSVAALGSAYLTMVEEDGDAGLYLMQIETIYYQKGRI